MKYEVVREWISTDPLQAGNAAPRREPLLRFDGVQAAVDAAREHVTAPTEVEAPRAYAYRVQRRNRKPIMHTWRDLAGALHEQADKVCAACASGCHEEPGMVCSCACHGVKL